MLSQVAWDHVEPPRDLHFSMASCVSHMCMATYEPTLAWCPLAGQVFPWPHGRMHPRYRKGTAVLAAWLHKVMVRHGPGTRGSIQMRGYTWVTACEHDAGTKQHHLHEIEPYTWQYFVCT